MFSCEFYDISKITFLAEHIWATASNDLKTQFKKKEIGVNVKKNNTDDQL